MLQYECHNEITCLFPNENPTFFKISVTITFIKTKSKRIYFYFGINSLKTNIANRIAFFYIAITVILGGKAPSRRLS